MRNDLGQRGAHSPLFCESRATHAQQQLHMVAAYAQCEAVGVASNAPVQCAYCA